MVSRLYKARTALLPGSVSNSNPDVHATGRSTLQDTHRTACHQDALRLPPAAPLNRGAAMAGTFELHGILRQVFGLSWTAWRFVVNVPAKNDNAVYRPGIRHKYQEATVRNGLHASPISIICLRVGCTSSPLSRR